MPIYLFIDLISCVLQQKQNWTISSFNHTIQVSCISTGKGPLNCPQIAWTRTPKIYEYQNLDAFRAKTYITLTLQGKLIGQNSVGIVIPQLLKSQEKKNYMTLAPRRMQTNQTVGQSYHHAVFRQSKAPCNK